MVNDELDPLIDEVAREMTSAPPRDGLARRVSMRIAAGDAGDAGDDVRSAVRPPRPWVLVPVASACIVLLAVFVARQVRTPVTPTAVPGMATAEPQAPYVERAVQARGGGDPDLSAEGLAKAERVALQTLQVRTPQALPDLPPATIAPIDVDRLEIQPIVEMTAINIGPIAIDRIEITAMP